MCAVVLVCQPCHTAGVQRAIAFECQRLTHTPPLSLCIIKTWHTNLTQQYTESTQSLNEINETSHCCVPIKMRLANLLTNLNVTFAHRADEES